MVSAQPTLGFEASKNDKSLLATDLMNYTQMAPNVCCVKAVSLSKCFEAWKNLHFH